MASSDASFASKLRVALYDQNCKDPADGKIVYEFVAGDGIGKTDNADILPEPSIVTVVTDSIGVNSPQVQFLLDTEVLISNDKIGNEGEITICARMSLGYLEDDDNNDNSNNNNNESLFKEVNFIESIITIIVDLSRDFTVAAFDVVPKAKKTEMNQKDSYAVTAFLCDPSTATDPIPSPKGETDVFKQGSLVTVCVTPDEPSRDDGIVMKSINGFTWKRTDDDDNIQQSAIVDNKAAANGLTSLVCTAQDQFCHFSSVLSADFYKTNGIVTGEGSASMEFEISSNSPSLSLSFHPSQIPSLSGLPSLMPSFSVKPSNVQSTTPSNVPTETPSTTFTLFAGVPEDATTLDVEQQIADVVRQSLLRDVGSRRALNPDISDIVIDVLAKEVSCNDIAAESGIDLSDKQCLQVFITITAPPSTGVNTDVAATNNEDSIASGAFAATLSDQGLVATIMLPPSEQPSDMPSSPPSTSVIPSSAPSGTPSDSPITSPSEGPSDIPSVFYSQVHKASALSRDLVSGSLFNGPQYGSRHSWAWPQANNKGCSRYATVDDIGTGANAMPCYVNTQLKDRVMAFNSVYMDAKFEFDKGMKVSIALANTALEAQTGPTSVSFYPSGGSVDTLDPCLAPFDGGTSDYPIRLVRSGRYLHHWYAEKITCNSATANEYDTRIELKVTPDW